MLGQRRYERVAFYCPVIVTQLPNGPVMEGNSFDISIGGVGVITTLTLERGQPVKVRFHISNGENTAVEEDVLGRIAYTRSDEDCTRLGIEFAEPIQESAYPVLAHKIEKL